MISIRIDMGERGLTCQVSDFGLSAIVDDQIRSDGLLHTLCGTPAYAAPENLNQRGYDGAKIDVWSCGVVLFVLTVSYLPFNDGNLMALYKKIYKGEYRCPRWMSPDLKRFLSRLLETNPETRITIDEILKDPWFRKGGYRAEINLSDEESEPAPKMSGDGEHDPKDLSLANLNAFDIISTKAITAGILVRCSEVIAQKISKASTKKITSYDNN
ncbi:hypothetical protein F8388_013558 [Cannabis sativa]|uniref:Protein kinase domain-containing protein n=1 Tax=Cannabis sativa TaxID=3483 RepID=A0A7J6HUM9_CANSA|nr:hypothetical protein F8388_013558 [Cannabis sativa]KAF4398438.1 hypothetical protein G4B88_025417 [Cannabis sativa]